MKREEAMQILQLYKDELEQRIDEADAPDVKDVCRWQMDGFGMAIEALSKPNYESDTEVRLAVTDRNKDKVVLWDAFGEVEYYPNGEINCVHCPHYYETEDDTGVHSHCGSHGRLIDADALSKKLCGTTIFIKDGEVFQRMINDAPTVQADRPHGEWVEVVERTEQYDREGVKTWATLYQCLNCGFVLNAIEGHIGQYNFCPNCGADMRGGGADGKTKNTV